MAAKELPSRRKTNRFRSIFTSLMAPFPQCRTYKKPDLRLKKAVPKLVYFREKNICFASLTSYLLDGKLGKHVAARIFSLCTKKSIKVSAVLRGYCVRF